MTALRDLWLRIIRPSAAAFALVLLGSSVAAQAQQGHPPGVSQPADGGVVAGVSPEGHARGLPETGAALLLEDPAAAPSGEPSGFAPPTVRADGHRSEIEAAWFSGGQDPARRAYSARNAALRLGADNFEPAARALLGAPADPARRVEYAQLAVELAPDVPSVRMALALAQMRAGEYGEAVGEAFAGLAAIPSNLEATLWLVGSLLAMFAAVLVVGPLLFILWVGVSVFRHGAHDLGDLISREMPNFARAALLAAVLLCPVALGEGAMGVALAFFVVGFTYVDGRGRRALTLAAVLLLLGLYPLARLTARAIAAIDADPVAVAAHAVVRGIATPFEVELLAAAEGDDVLADAALALWERRAGNREAAMARYTQLLEIAPDDPNVLAALANMHFELGDYERSIELSERAAGLLNSPTLLFNLSQVYARSFRMDEFEGAMAQAQALDAPAIAALSRTAAPDFVADLPFDNRPIWARLVERTADAAFSAPATRAVMPGWLGSSWGATAAGFGLAVLMPTVLGRRWEHSSSCRRCGRRICTRCDGTVWNNEICEGCHHLFHRPEATDPRLRHARLSQLRERESRLGRIALVSSLLLPGVSGLLARRPGLSFLGLFFFAWGVVLFVWREGIVPDPMAVGAAGPLAFMIAGGVVALCYVAVVATGLWVRRSL